MTSRLLISLSLLLFAWQKAGAQLAPADDFFNGGAQLYISNNVPAALERVELGLKTYPDDVKLKKLEELLKQKNQQQQQQNQQQQQQNQSQQQKSDSQKNQQQQKQNSQDQQKPDEQQKQQEEQKSSAQKNEGEKPDKPDAQAQPVKPGELTKDEAKRLLDAQKDNEQILQMKPQAKPRNPDQPVRDW
jgi:Ca-activated chloride channel family protein